MNNLKHGKGFYIVISLLIAVAFWFYVVNEVSTEAKDTIRNIPVVVSGQEELLERELLLTAQSFESIDLKIEGNRKSLMKLTRENIVVSVDVSGIKKAGEYELRCNISLPNTISASSVTIKNRDNRVKLTVEERVRKNIEVEGNFTGSLVSGYEAEEFIISPGVLEIAGPASLMENIACARVNLNESGLTETYSGMLPVEFIDHDGYRVYSGALECAVSEVYTVFPIVMVKDIPLTVEVIPGGGAEEKHITCEIEPKMIRVSGPGTEVSKLSEIVLGEIDLAKVGNMGHFEFNIELPENLKSKGQETVAAVTITVEGLSTKMLEVNHFEVVNVPPNYVSSVRTDRIRVTLRGETSAVESVLPSQIKAVADLSELTEEGIHKVKVELRLNGVTDAGVLDEGRAILVQLKKLGE